MRAYGTMRAFSCPRLGLQRVRRLGDRLRHQHHLARRQQVRDDVPRSRLRQYLRQYLHQYLQKHLRPRTVRQCCCLHHRAAEYPRRLRPLPDSRSCRGPSEDVRRLRPAQSHSPSQRRSGRVLT